MYARLRVHAVQCALLMRLKVNDTSVTRLDTDLAGTSFDYVVPDVQLLKFRLAILSDELTAGQSKVK